MRCGHVQVGTLHDRTTTAELLTARANTLAARLHIRSWTVLSIRCSRSVFRLGLQAGAQSRRYLQLRSAGWPSVLRPNRAICASLAGVTDAGVVPDGR